MNKSGFWDRITILMLTLKHNIVLIIQASVVVLGLGAKPSKFTLNLKPCPDPGHLAPLSDPKPYQV